MHGGKAFFINMQGVVIGNPVIRGYEPYPSMLSYFRSHGLASKIDSDELL